MPMCFVVGPIGKDATRERKHSDLLLHAVIKAVLIKEGFGYLVKRADEDADPGMTGDRVVSDIINAELVVADLTNLNPNAFYELGIRHSTEKPTIHMARVDTILPFDNVSHRTIFVDLSDWHSMEKAREQLAASVRATRVDGYKVSNPITQANASFKMRMSDDPRDNVMAEMQERLEALESSSRATAATPTFVSAFDTNAARRRQSNSYENTIEDLAVALSAGTLAEAAKAYSKVVPSASLAGARNFAEAMRTSGYDVAASIHAKAARLTKDDADKLIGDLQKKMLL